MPELPEVETMVRGVSAEAIGRRITDMEFCPCPRKPLTVSPRAEHFRAAAKGRKIVNIRRLAKRVVIELNDGDFIVVEPRMTGLILVAEPPTVEHRRICWHLSRRRASAPSFEFWDRRGLGTVRLLDEQAMNELEAKLGPDALKMSIADWKDRFGRTSRPVKVAMLEQKLVAGIGNLYASEILHRAGVSPRRMARRVSADSWLKIQEATLFILNEAIRYEGSTLGDGTYRNVLNQNGSYQNKHLVYQKAGESCPTCSEGVIKRIVQAQRATFYCPACQRG